MPYQHREFPDMSWSHSRRDMFRQCLRKYYYNYYASHNGWRQDGSEHAQRAYRLKNLTSLPLEIGAVVHEAASQALHAVRSGTKMPTVEQMYAAARSRLNKAWADSQNRDQWMRSPKYMRMFREFYYNVGVDEHQVAEAKEQVNACLSHLPNSVSFQEAAAAPHAEMRATEGFVTYNAGGTPVHAVPDLAFQNSRDEWTVVDWKSGKQEDSREQMTVYALYLREMHGVAAPSIRARIEWLWPGEAEELVFTEGDLDRCAEGIRDSVSAMQQYLADPALNAPLMPEDFPLRADREECRLCEFYELDEEQLAEGAGRSF